jgi:hypothetical protein
MLDNFPDEIPVARIEPKPAELVGFAPEAPPTPRQASTRTTWNWHRSAWPTAVLWMGWVCAAITLGTVAARSGTAAERPPRVSVFKQIPVFMPTTPVLISTTGRRAPVEKPRVAALKEPAGRRVARAASKPEAPRPKAAVAASHPRAAVATIPRQPISMVRSEIRQPQVQPAPAAIPARPAPVPLVAPSSPLPVAATAGVVGRASEEAAVRAVLEQYRGAYERLDADAARRIWPGVDERRLARAFSDLESQTLDFDRCRVDVTSRRGTAHCRGRATYIARVGKREPQTQVRDWTFQLWKAGDSWTIESIRSQ